MIPWKLLDTATVPGSSSQLLLYQRDGEFSIRVGGAELMNSRVYTSDDGFSQLGCERVQGRPKLRVLIGGLGMGYSLRSALDQLRPDARVVVAELVPQVATWNRELFGHLADHPLRDPRVKLEVIDVGELMRGSKAAFDLIMLDVDNGPEGLTRKSNDWIYSHAGLLAARAALSPRGVVGYWSSGADRSFVRRLQKAGFEVEELTLRSGVGRRGAKHTLWFARVRSASRERP